MCAGIGEDDPGNTFGDWGGSGGSGSRRRSFASNSIPKVTAKETLQIIHTLMAKTTLPPRGSDLHRIIQRVSYRVYGETEFSNDLDPFLAHFMYVMFMFFVPSGFFRILQSHPFENLYPITNMFQHKKNDLFIFHRVDLKIGRTILNILKMKIHIKK